MKLAGAGDFHNSCLHLYGRGAGAASKRNVRLGGQRHFDEMYVKVNGEMRYLWRAVAHAGEILKSFVTSERDKAAALKLMKKAMKRFGKPEAVTTDGLRSYNAALNELGNADWQHIGR